MVVMFVVTDCGGFEWRPSILMSPIGNYQFAEYAAPALIPVL